MNFYMVSGNRMDYKNLPHLEDKCVPPTSTLFLVAVHTMDVNTALCFSTGYGHHHSYRVQHRPLASI